jgi:3-keto-disaccharide hydrolase
MKRAILLVFGAVILRAETPFLGRWDINVTTARFTTDPDSGFVGAATYPDWMEVRLENDRPQVRVQPRTGSVRPVSKVDLDGSHMTLTLEPAGRNPEITWDLTFANGKISGVQKRGGREMAKLEGVRAPELKKRLPTSWSQPEPIFNGKDLTGWEPFQATNHWAVQNGELVNVEKGADLRTTRKFQDFKLHIELNCPDGGNSGIYLRGRYEIQVAYETEPDNFHSMGSIYGMLAPSREMPRKPGQWESFDATLVGRWITLVRDGVTILDNQEIAGITGGALDANEAQPGPFYLQGDHTGGMKYRNITVSVPK